MSNSSTILGRGSREQWESKQAERRQAQAERDAAIAADLTGREPEPRAVEAEPINAELQVEPDTESEEQPKPVETEQTVYEPIEATVSTATRRKLHERMTNRGKSLAGLWGPVPYEMARVYTPVLKPHATLVFAALCGHLRNKAETWPSQRQLAWELGLTLSAVNKAIKGLSGEDGRLEQFGLPALIEIDRSERDNGRIVGNSYRFTAVGLRLKPTTNKADEPP